MTKINSAHSKEPAMRTNDDDNDQPLTPILELTDELIDVMDTTLLRLHAADHVSKWSQTDEIATLPIGPEVVRQEGLLTLTDHIVAAYLKAYDARWPEVEQQYGRIMIKVWRSDSDLRSLLRQARLTAQEKTAEAPSAPRGAMGEPLAE